MAIIRIDITELRFVGDETQTEGEPDKRIGITGTAKVGEDTYIITTPLMPVLMLRQLIGNYHWAIYMDKLTTAVIPEGALDITLNQPAVEGGEGGDDG